MVMQNWRISCVTYAARRISIWSVSACSALRSIAELRGHAGAIRRPDGQAFSDSLDLRRCVIDN